MKLFETYIKRWPKLKNGHKAKHCNKSGYVCDNISGCHITKHPFRAWKLCWYSCCNCTDVLRIAISSFQQKWDFQ